MLSDPWLDRWMPLVAERSGQVPVLEIGCGHGDDTVTLTKAGLDVVAFDLSPVSVAAARLRAPGARIECRDTRDPFPAAATPLGVVVASLSLHYFPWTQTVSIVERIRGLPEAWRPPSVPAQLDGRPQLRRGQRHAHRRELLSRQWAAQALLRQGRDRTPFRAGLAPAVHGTHDFAQIPEAEGDVGARAREGRIGP
ncbi:class I SAM-dependent methyltransferase [Variovorax boronicumulans]|uniref:class I SAM-dependent methyltransferase n=1 Tax=Variovorax boronicumulans TaxID=436515 RepID=UPI0027DB3AFB